jgi:hypothetical protein
MPRTGSWRVYAGNVSWNERSNDNVDTGKLNISGARIHP